MSRYSRDNDCFSRMFKLGTDLFKYDRHFEGKPVGGAVKKAFFTVTVLSDLQNAMKTVGICYAQYNSSATEGWLDWFEPSQDEEETDT